MWAQAWNETQDKPLLARVRRCAGFACRLRGLTFRRALPTDEGLLLVGPRENRAEAAIHMFFVFFPIGVLWLDSGMRVVDKTIARPFRPFYQPRAAARYILEGPPVIVERAQVGDRLRFDAAPPHQRTGGSA